MRHALNHADKKATADEPRTTWFIWITTADSAVDHAVTDAAMAAGAAARLGLYRSVCDAVFEPAPLVCPPAPACPQCLRILSVRTPQAANRHATARRNNSRIVDHGVL